LSEKSIAFLRLVCLFKPLFSAGEPIAEKPETFSYPAALAAGSVKLSGCQPSSQPKGWRGWHSVMPSLKGWAEYS